MVVASGALRPPARVEAPPPAEAPHPSTTTVDGSRHAAVTASEPAVEAPRAWAPPPWLSEANRDGTSTSTGHASHAPSTTTQVATPAPSSTTQLAPTATAVPASEVSSDTAATLDDVALRMSRIKASAAAIREAIEVEAQRASVGAAPPPAPPARAPAPTTVHESRAAANDVGDDNDDELDAQLDSELDAILPGRDSSGPVGMPVRLPPRREAAPQSGLEADFLGSDDDFEDGDEIGDGDDHGVAAFAPAARPIPWRPILIAAGAMVAIGAFVFRDQIFGTSAATDASVAEVRSGAVVPDEKRPEPKAPAKAEPAPTPAPDPAAGKPVTADPSAVAGVPAPGTPAPGTLAPGTPAAGTPTPAPGTVAPAPTTPGTPAAARPAPDADTSARLDEARSLYVAAKGGTQRKKLGEAKTLLQEILTTAPMQADALLLLSQIELELGHADAALTTATQCTQAAADLADCWLTIGVLQQDRRKKAEATAAYEKYLALAPDGRYAGDVRSQLKRLKK
jgi:TolA-binding protein